MGLLVLSRKVNQSIQVGNDIRITLVRIQGNKCRIGVDAPEHVTILRDELEPIDLSQPGPEEAAA